MVYNQDHSIDETYPLIEQLDGSYETFQITTREDDDYMYIATMEETSKTGTFQPMATFVKSFAPKTIDKESFIGQIIGEY